MDIHYHIGGASPCVSNCVTADLYTQEAGMKQDHPKQDAGSPRVMNENSGLYCIQGSLLNPGFLVLWIQRKMHNL